MRINYVTFRGEEGVAVEYHDYGYEPDVDAHDIDWNFADENKNLLALTEEEEEQIYQHLLKLSYDQDGD